MISSHNLLQRTFIMIKYQGFKDISRTKWKRWFQFLKKLVIHSKKIVATSFRLPRRTSAVVETVQTIDEIGQHQRKDIKEPIKRNNLACFSHPGPKQKGVLSYQEQLSSLFLVSFCFIHACKLKIKHQVHNKQSYFTLNSVITCVRQDILICIFFSFFQYGRQILDAILDLLTKNNLFECILCLKMII